MNVKCKECESYRMSYRWQPLQGGGAHIRVTCLGCNRFVKFAAQTAEAIRLADLEAPYSYNETKGLFE